MSKTATKQDDPTATTAGGHFKPRVQLTGPNGPDSNVFAIIGRVSAVLKQAGQKDRAKEFATRAMASHSYDEVLSLCQEYVRVA